MAIMTAPVFAPDANSVTSREGNTRGGGKKRSELICGEQKKYRPRFPSICANPRHVEWVRKSLGREGRLTGSLPLSPEPNQARSECGFPASPAMGSGGRERLTGARGPSGLFDRAWGPSDLPHEATKAQVSRPVLFYEGRNHVILHFHIPGQAFPSDRDGRKTPVFGLTVRTEEDFAADPRLIPGAIRRSHQGRPPTGAAISPAHPAIVVWHARGRGKLAQGDSGPGLAPRRRVGGDARRRL